MFYKIRSAVRPDFFFAVVFFSLSPYHCWNNSVMQCLLKFSALWCFFFGFVFWVTAIFFWGGRSLIGGWRKEAGDSLEIWPYFFYSMVFLQFLVGHLVKLRWRLSTLHQLKWFGAHRCPPSSTVRSEDTRCTMSGWLMGSLQDSQSSRTSWLMMPRYNNTHHHCNQTHSLPSHSSDT